MNKPAIPRFTIIVLVLLSNYLLNAQDNRPNIVLIMADDLGFECINTYGGTSYKTPNIDKLASQGIKFENCHAQALCTPSRVQIMTGRYNVRNYTGFGQLDRKQISFGNLFRNAGYKTVIAGKWQLGKENDSPQHFGFEESCLWQQSLPRTDSSGHDTRFSNPVLEFNGKIQYFENGEYGPDIVSDFICSFIKKNMEHPFLVYYPMLLTHCPFVATPDSKDWDPNSKGSLDYKGNPENYKDMVAYMDKIVGKVISTIEESGLSEKTLIIFTGDNGTDQPVVSQFRGRDYPGGKGRTTDNGTHVPLIVRWDGRINAGMECDDLIDFSDFHPTLCEAADISISSVTPVDGNSFLPQLLGETGVPRQWIYSWYCPHGKELKEFARNKEYKLYRTGQFFNVKNDIFEKESLHVDHLNREEKKIYKSMGKALKIYKDIQLSSNSINP